MSKTRLRISDHALLRYAERVLGFDRAQAHAELSRHIGATVALCPDCQVPFEIAGEHFIAVVRNRTLLTITPKQSVPPPPKPKRPKAFRPLPDPADFRLLPR